MSETVWLRVAYLLVVAWAIGLLMVFPLACLFRKKHYNDTRTRRF